MLDEHWPRALDVLADMVQNPTFAEDEIEREKGVILEELKMDEDNPDYLLGTIFAGSFWRDHGMGRPVIGTQGVHPRFRPQPITPVLCRDVPGSESIARGSG